MHEVWFCLARFSCKVEIFGHIGTRTRTFALRRRRATITLLALEHRAEHDSAASSLATRHSDQLNYRCILVEVGRFELPNHGVSDHCLNQLGYTSIAMAGNTRIELISSVLETEAQPLYQFPNRGGVYENRTHLSSVTGRCPSRRTHTPKKNNDHPTGSCPTL